MGIYLNNICIDEQNESIEGQALKQLLHDIKSPITAVGVCLKRLENSNSKEVVDLLRLSFDRLNSMTSVRQDTLGLVKSNVSDVIKKIIQEKTDSVELSPKKDASTTIRNNSNIPTTPTIEFKGETLALAYFDESVFSRAISNMLNNSIEAHASRIIFDVQKKSNKVLIRISDNGLGIDPSLKSLVGRRGFSTKNGGQGLGLSFAIKSIKEWGGSLTMESSKGLEKNQIDFVSRDSGTTIRIELLA